MIYCHNMAVFAKFVRIAALKHDLLPLNRAYPENANSNTCAPNTLKFHTFCGLCETKQCFKFELDILNGSGVIAT